MKTIVIIPTYNEKENIENLIKEILKQDNNIHILVVDDDSPDGTADIVTKLAKKNKKVHLLLRKTNKGRGAAGKAGFIKALEMKADAIIEMDADFSHNPRYIPKMLSMLKDYDIILGSRQAKGGKDIGRSWLRVLLTKGANLYIRIILGLKVKDCNSGFRCFKRQVFQKVNPNNLFSTGPAIVQELLYKCHVARLKITEIPIIFKEREQGQSTLNISKLIKGYTTILQLRWMKLTNRLKL